MNKRNKHFELILVITIMVSMTSAICLAGCDSNQNSSEDVINKMISYDIPDGWEEVDTNEESVHLIMKDVDEFPYIAIFVDKENSSNATIYDSFAEFKDNVAWITDNEGQYASKKRECSKAQIDGNTAYLAYEEYTEKEGKKLKYYWDYEMVKDGFAIIISMETDNKIDSDVFERFISNIIFNDKN